MCDARVEKVLALYSNASGLLDLTSRAHPRFLSPAPWNIIIYYFNYIYTLALVCLFKVPEFIID